MMPIYRHRRRPAMNRYGQIALDQHCRHRPLEHSQIDDPNEFFEEIGDEIQAEVTSYRDEILGRPRPGETAEAYRLRSYQVLATAEEMVMAGHHLFQPKTGEMDEMDESDPILDQYFRDLAEINRVIHTA
jgi:hypothetical protein